MKESKSQLGLVSVSFRQHSPKEILEVTRSVGLSCIEWGSDVHAPCHDTARLEEIAALQKEYGIFCSSYGTYFRLGETPIEELEAYIQAAKILDTNILRLWCGGKNGKDMTNEERDALLDVCGTAAKVAEASGVTLCLECHKKTFTEDPDDAVRLMETVNSPHFRMYWQPFQWRSIKENLAYAERIAPFTCHIHVFQWKNKERFSLGEGIEEWQCYLQKFSTPHTLLLEFMPDDRIESLPTEAAILKLIIGESR